MGDVPLMVNAAKVGDSYLGTLGGFSAIDAASREERQREQSSEPAAGRSHGTRPHILPDCQRSCAHGRMASQTRGHRRSRCRSRSTPRKASRNGIADPCSGAILMGSRLAAFSTGFIARRPPENLGSRPAA